MVLNTMNTLVHDKVGNMDHNMVGDIAKNHYMCCIKEIIEPDTTVTVTTTRHIYMYRICMICIHAYFAFICI